MTNFFSKWLPQQLTRRLVPGLAGMTLLGLTAGGPAQAQNFGTAATYGTGGSNSYFVAAGDLNGDGRADIVTSNLNGAESSTPLGSLSVLLSLPSGGFSTAVTYPTGGRVTYGVTLGDVNGDGRLDAVAVNSTTDNVSIMLGTGTGTLGAAIIYPLATGSRPFSVALGDINLDGRLDIVTANSHFNTGGSGTASVLLGVGGGAFTAAVGYSAGTGSSPRGITLADITLDGRLDAILTDVTGGTVVVMPGLSGGQLGVARPTFAGGSYPFFVEAGDVNQDGRLDIVTSNASSSVIGVLLGQSTGTLASALTYATNGTTPDGLELSDVNFDGRLDVVVSNFGSNTVAVLPGTGGGLFGSAVTYATGTAPYGLAVGDFNQDGKPDIVTANSGSTNVSVLLNNTITTPAVTTLTVSNIGTTSATVGGTVTSQGSSTVTDRGIVISATVQTPTINDTKIQIGTGTGSYSQFLTGLTAGTTYYVRAYAINSSGISYGSVVSFTTTPNAPVVTGPANNSQVTTRTPTYSGTAQSGSTVRVYVDGLLIGSTTATNGSFSLGQPTNLTEGLHSVYATAQIGGSAISASSNFNTFTVDATAPTVAISSTAGPSGSISSTAPVPFTVTFSEAVTGYDAADVTANVTNAASVSLSGSGTTYFVQVTPAGNGAVTLNVPANVAQDGAGNNNVAATSSYTIVYNQPVTTAPVVTSPTSGSRINVRTPAYTGTAPTGSTVRLYVDGQLIGSTTATTGGFSLAQPTNLADGLHSVYATAQAGGSAVSANSNTNTFTVDATAPTVAISSTAGNPTNVSPIPVLVTFSKSVTGFTASDVVVTNGTLSAVSGSGTTYTFTITPTATGLVTVNIAANQAQDAAGNGNTAAPQFSIQYNGPTATKNGLTAGNVSLYPNPAHQNFTLLVPAVRGVSQAALTLYNALGQPVRTSTLALPATGAEATVDVQGLPAGMYVLRLTDGATTIVTKQVVVK